MKQPYHPIACSLHDELEAHATLRHKCRITFRGGDGKAETIADVIADIFTHDREEFLRLHHGRVIRLDQILSINDKVFDEARSPH